MIEFLSDAALGVFLKEHTLLIVAGLGLLKGLAVLVPSVKTNKISEFLQTILGMKK